METRLVGRAQGDSFEELRAIWEQRVETIKASKWKGEAETMSSLCLEWPGIHSTEFQNDPSAKKTIPISSATRLPGVNVDLGTQILFISVSPKLKLVELLFEPQYVWDMKTKTWKQQKAPKTRKKKLDKEKEPEKTQAETI